MAKQEYRWEDPGLIYVPHHLNNRELNHDYVRTLEDSMRTEGFLPTFPIVIFRLLELPYFDNIVEREIFICACGAHRTTAAKNVGLEKVYVDIRSGTMDDFFEVMHTDNFQFDPETDSSLGQLFTKKEKREACQSLLTLPKYLKMTNVALSQLWHTSEANIRRWRDEVVQVLKDGEKEFSFEYFPEGRKAEIQAILDSNIREDIEGNVVRVRSRSSGPDRWEFYRNITNRFNEVAGEKGMPQHSMEMRDDTPLSWDIDGAAYVENIYDHRNPDSLPLQKLSEIDILINAKDKAFFEKCRHFGSKARKLTKARDACTTVYHECVRAFRELMGIPDRYEYQEERKKVEASFGKAVARQHGRNLLAGLPTRDTVNSYRNDEDTLKMLLGDIQRPAEYVQKFFDRYYNRRRKTREKLETELIEAHHAMLAHVQKKYPRIDLEKFALSVDGGDWRVDIGDTRPTPMKSSDINEYREDRQLRNARDYYKEVLTYTDMGADWIEACVPEALPLQEALDEMKESSRSRQPSADAEDTIESLWEQIIPAISAWKSARKGKGVGYASKTMFINATKCFDSDFTKDSEIDAVLLRSLLNLLTSPEPMYMFERFVKMQCYGASIWEDSDQNASECNWSRVSSAFDVISAELSKIEWTDAEKVKIDKIASDINAVFDKYRSPISRNTKLWVLGNLAYEYMEELSKEGT